MENKKLTLEQISNLENDLELNFINYVGVKVPFAHLNRNAEQFSKSKRKRYCPQITLIDKETRKITIVDIECYLGNLTEGDGYNYTPLEYIITNIDREE